MTWDVSVHWVTSWHSAHLPSTLSTVKQCSNTQTTLKFMIDWLIDWLTNLTWPDWLTDWLTGFIWQCRFASNLILLIIIIIRPEGQNIRASPTRIFFSQSQWNPTVRSVQMPSPSSPLWANAWLVPPATCARCHIYSTDSRSLYSVSIWS